jgi:hypothetical protein
MRAFMVAAAVAFLRWPIRDSGRKRAELFFQLFAAAMHALFRFGITGSTTLTTGRYFEKFTYPAAFTALIFIDWHTDSHSINN